jgi:hypothetical protein
METSPDGAAPADTSGSEDYMPMSREAIYADPFILERLKPRDRPPEVTQT